MFQIQEKRIFTVNCSIDSECLITNHIFNDEAAIFNKTVQHVVKINLLMCQISIFSTYTINTSETKEKKRSILRKQINRFKLQTRISKMCNRMNRDFGLFRITCGFSVVFSSCITICYKIIICFSLSGCYDV